MEIVIGDEKLTEKIKSVAREAASMTLPQSSSTRMSQRMDHT